jgi:hypothetical protein
MLKIAEVFLNIYKYQGLSAASGKQLVSTLGIFNMV